MRSHFDLVCDVIGMALFVWPFLLNQQCMLHGETVDVILSLPAAFGFLHRSIYVHCQNDKPKEYIHLIATLINSVYLKLFFICVSNSI